MFVERCRFLWWVGPKLTADSWLEQPLLNFSDDPSDVWTVRSACQGCQIFGSTGSGKSTGSAQLIARAMLRLGAGGLVLTCKSGETAIWQKYCREAGRLNDLIIFGPSQPWRFDFMAYEYFRSGAGGRMTENLVRLFSTLAEVIERKTHTQTQDYWSRAMNQLVRNALQLAAVSRGTPSLDLISQIIATAPVSLEQLRSDQWQESSVCFACIREGESAQKSETQRADWPQVLRFWKNEFPSLSDRTRSCIVSMFTTMAELFLRGEIRRLFCTTINIDPEVTFKDRKILVIDLPTVEFDSVGVLSQVLWKYCWQRAVERRDVSKSPVPTFLWADEAQHFVTGYDASFQMICRSARAMTVYISQALPNFYSVMTRNETEALLANMATRIWHRNSCTVTNAAAVETIARQRQFRWTAETSFTEGRGGGERISRNMGGGDAIAHQILPADFQVLRSGGPENKLLVDGIVYENGRIWSSGKNHLKVTFSQNDVP